MQKTEREQKFVVDVTAATLFTLQGYNRTIVLADGYYNKICILCIVWPARNIS